jgi:hypothetical protein
MPILRRYVSLSRWLVCRIVVACWHILLNFRQGGKAGRSVGDLRFAFVRRSRRYSRDDWMARHLSIDTLYPIIPRAPISDVSDAM